MNLLERNQKVRLFFSEVFVPSLFFVILGGANLLFDLAPRLRSNDYIIRHFLSDIEFLNDLLKVVQIMVDPLQLDIIMLIILEICLLLLSDNLRAILHVVKAHIIEYKNHFRVIFKISSLMEAIKHE